MTQMSINNSVFLENPKYVLMTDGNNYFVEYLLNELIISDSISEAMVFTDINLAKKFKEMLNNNCNLIVNISTFIN